MGRLDGTTAPRRLGGGHDLAQISLLPAAPAGTGPPLALGAPGDIYEQQADRVADMVMQAPVHATRPAAAVGVDIRPTPPRLARSYALDAPKGIEDEDEPFVEDEDEPFATVEPEPAAEKCDCEPGDERVQRAAGAQRSESVAAEAPTLGPEIATGVQAMRGGGQALPSSTRGFMEPRLGADFSAVRIHAHQDADTYSRALQARAFTLGGDIFFRAGEYRPGTAEGDRLLAHELTHTIQQGAAGPVQGRRVSAHRAVARVLQRQPAAPVVAPPPLVSQAGVTFLPVLHDKVPAGWGVTTADRPVIDITAFVSGATWKCAITTATQQAHQGVRLLAGVVEVTPALVAAEANCATLQTMITSLNSVASQGSDSGFYMLAAVQAHEDVHIRHYRNDLAPHYATLKTAVEALSVPLAGSADAAAAKAAIKALPAFTTALATFVAGHVTSQNTTAAHAHPADFDVAEHGVVDPMIATIRARRTALTCPP